MALRKSSTERRRIDWVGAIGQTVVTLLGPAAAPLSFLLAIRDSLDRDEASREQVNDVIAELVDARHEASSLYPVLIDAAPDAPPVTAALYALMVDQLRVAPLSAETEPDEELLQRLASLTQAIRTRPKPLRQALAQHYPRERDVVMLLRDALVKPEQVELLGTGEQMWGSALERLDGQRPIHLLLLLAEAHQQHPAVPEFDPSFWAHGCAGE